MDRRLERQRGRLQRAEQSLSALSPRAVLGRGYAIVSSADGRVVRRSEDLAFGERIHVQLAEGEVDAIVS